MKSSSKSQTGAKRKSWAESKDLILLFFLFASVLGFEFRVLIIRIYLGFRASDLEFTHFTSDEARVTSHEIVRFIHIPI